MAIFRFRGDKENDSESDYDTEYENYDDVQIGYDIDIANGTLTQDIDHDSMPVHLSGSINTA